LKIERYLRAAVGPPDAFLSGLLLDAGDKVLFPDGTTEKNMCGILAVAALARTARPRAHQPECNPGFILLMQTLDDYLKIPLQLLLDNPHSRLADIHHAFASLKGIPDSWPSLANPPLLKGYHLLHVCQDSEDLSHFTYRLNVVHSALAGERYITASSAKKLLLPWTFDHSKSFVFSLPVLIVCPLVFSDGRHSLGLKTGLSSLKEVVTFLAAIATQHKGQVILSRRGAFTDASRTVVVGALTPDQIRADRERLQELRDRGMTALNSVVDPWPTPLLPELDDPAEESEQEEYPEVKAMLRQVQPDLQSASIDTSGAFPDPPPDTLWKILKPHVELAQSSEEYFLLYQKHVAPLLEAVEETNSMELRAGLSYSGRFNNQWLRFLITKKGRTPTDALHEIVASYRLGFFGPDNVTHGPHPDEVHKLLAGKIPEEHLTLFSEMITRGADPVYLGPTTGYTAKPYPSTREIDDQALWDFLALICAQRGVDFDLSEGPEIEGWLLAAGVHLGPIIAAVKRSAHGQDLVDEWDRLVMRLCNDSTNGNHPLAANSGLHSWQHSLQKTTSASQVAYHQIKEEKKHPNCEVRAVRDDIRKAFNLIAILLRRLGLFASLVSDIALVNLNLPFGPKPCPGIFDALGDIFHKALHFTDRSEEDRWSNPIGVTHPELARFVDDLFSVVAQYGNRTQDHLARLRKQLTDCLGPHSLNLEKQGVEGTPQPYKHAFGAVLDCCGRRLKACWSKLLKVSALMLPYINKEVDYPSHEVVEQIRGVAGHATGYAPGAARLLLPRLDAWLSSVATQHPDGHIPKGARGSFRLSGDPTEEYSNEKFRGICNVFVRLALIEEGELFQLPLEASLPRHLRLTFPGKELPSNRVQFVMDASGTGYFIIDLSTGRYLWEEYSEEENFWFNRFSEGEGATIINHREFLTQLRGAVVLGVFHPGKLIDFLNDNTGAVADTQKPQCHSNRNELTSGMLGLIQLLLQQTHFGDYIETGKNPADYPTRPASYAKAHEWLADFQQRTGLIPEKIELEGDLAWLKSVGWEKRAGESEDSSFLGCGVKYLEWLLDCHLETATEACPVPPSLVQKAFCAGVRGDPIESLPEFVENFPEFSGPSPQRLLLTKEFPYTRMTLTRKLKFGTENTRAANLKSLRKKRLLADQDSTDPEVIINSILQRQFQDNLAVLSVKNEDFDASLKPRLQVLPQVVDLQALATKVAKAANQNTPTLRVAEDMPFVSAYSGQNGAGKAARYCHYADLRAAESNPILREHIQRDSPGTQVEADVAVYRQEKTTELRYSTMYQSPHCTSYSAANNAAKHTEDEDLGTTFEDTALDYEHLQVNLGVTECVSGILVRRKGKPSALDRFRKKAPSFHVIPVTINAAQIISPITDEQAAVSHERVMVFAFNRKDYPQPPKLQVLQHLHPPLESFAHHLDALGEGRSYQVMPIDDRRDLQYEWRRSDTGIAYVARIRDPQPGRGHPSFINDVLSPELGISSTTTAAGGGSWIQARLNGAATVRKERNEEIARRQLVRGFDSGPDKALLADDSEMGLSLLGNMLPQSSNDLVLAQMAICQSEIQKDGMTGYEKWVQRKQKFSLQAKREETSAGSHSVPRAPVPTLVIPSLGETPREIPTLVVVPPRKPPHQSRLSHDTPCGCKVKCEPSWSDTLHGSHGYRCEAVFRAAFPWKFPPSIGTPHYRITATPSAEATAKAKHLKQLADCQQSESAPTSAGPVPATPPRRGKMARPKPVFTPAHKEKYEKFSREVRYNGKKLQTQIQYTGAMKHWIDFAEGLGLPVFLDGLSYDQRSQQAELFASYEVLEFQNRVGTIRSKLSAIRWMHVRERKRDPFKGLDTLSDWLTELEKGQPPKDPSAAVPVQLLELIILHTDTSTVIGAIIASAATLGFWFLLRSIEYLSADCGVFDPHRSLTWEDVTLRKQGEVVPHSQFQEADEVSITVFSGKGTLHTCTRSLKLNQESPTCVIKWLKNLHAVLLKHGIAPLQGDSLFKKPDGKVLTRADLSAILKAAAVACGVVSSKVASHSLRRGGASAYAAAGVPHYDIQKFGRWTSDGYKVYITIHADVMTQGKVNPALVIPRFERN
jgi:hypothetical protein